MAAGSQQTQDAVLKVMLEQAKPSWSQQTVATVQQRLEKVGICTSEDLRASVSRGDLNHKLRKKELKTFTSETLDEFRRFFGLDEKHRSSTALAIVDKATDGADEAAGRGVKESRVNQKKDVVKAMSEVQEAAASFSRFSRVTARVPPAAAGSAPSAPSAPPRAIADVAAFAGEALVDAALSCGIDISKLERDQEDEINNLIMEVKRSERMTSEKLTKLVSGWGLPVENFAERSVLKNLAKEFLIWKVMKMPFLRDVCVEKIGVNVSDELSREQLVQLIIDRCWEENGIPKTRLKSLEDAQWIFDEVDNLSFITQPQELVEKCRRFGIPTANIPARGIEAHLKKMLKQAFIWNRMSVDALRRECLMHGLSLEPGRQVGKAASETFVLCEALLQFLGTPAFLDRGVPRDRFPDEDACNFVIQEVEKFHVASDLHLLAECRHRDVPIPKGEESHLLVQRLRQDFIWQNLPEQELQKDCEKEGIDVHRGMTRSAMVTALNDRQRLRDEVKARSIPADKFSSMEEVMEVVEFHMKVDNMDREDLMEWYESLDFPREVNLQLDDARDLYKWVVTWDNMLLPELLKEAVAKAGADEQDVDTNDDPAAQRSFLISKLVGWKRMELWDGQGFQATRVGDLAVACKIVEQFAFFEVMTDEELEAAYLQSGLIPEAAMQRDEQLHMLKCLLVWEALPLEDLEKECSTRGVPVEVSALEENEDIRSAVFSRLAALERMGAWEAAGFQANRIGDPVSVSRVVSCYQQCRQMSDFELEEQYRSAGLRIEKEQSRESKLVVLLHLLMWQEMPRSELASECVQKQLPVPQVAKREDLFQLLLIDKIATECRFCFDKRGIPCSLLAAPWMAYELACRFDELEAMQPDQLHEELVQLNVEVEDGMGEAEQRRRLMDISVWQCLNKKDDGEWPLDEDSHFPTAPAKDREKIDEALGLDVRDERLERFGIKDAECEGAVSEDLSSTMEGTAEPHKGEAESDEHSQDIENEKEVLWDDSMLQISIVQAEGKSLNDMD